MAYIRLRGNPTTLSFEDGRKLFGLEKWTNGNFSNLWRPTSYIQYPAFAERFLQKGITIIDIVTGLMWQKLAEGQFDYEMAENSIHELNNEAFAGHSDWRMPTVPEFMSLLQLDEKMAGGGQFIDPIFEKRKITSNSGGHSYWTIDKCTTANVWHVNCAILDISPLTISQKLFVRAVRSHVIPRNSIEL